MIFGTSLMKSWQIELRMPFGHSLAGYIVSAYKSKTFRLNNVKILALYVFIANAPDLDFIPGILIGKPN